MSYLVLARKYRPQTFDEVISQTHITQTLVNAISMGRVAHAILFAGPRGTGKTTIARILAKAMNCIQGPTVSPCNECRSCLEITSGRAADVFEIDGASNNSVDQVRELRENAKYLPVYSKYKIYIIDEVHMLSIAAFNALLKILEEPPSHVMFVFATTESHKIPITILSRCQRHDFRRIDAESILMHMERLCEAEHRVISKEGLGLIANEAGGSMRDALSLLDQVMACGEGTIEYPQVLEILGVVDRKLMFDISEAILKGDINAILDVLDEIYDRGHDLKKFYGDLVQHFRNLLVVKIAKEANALVDLPKHEIEMMIQQVQTTSAGYLNQILDLLFKEDATIRYTAHTKLALEMVFMRLHQTPPMLPIDELIEKMDDLRRAIGSSGGKRGIGSPGPNESEKDKPVFTPEDSAAPKKQPLQEKGLPTRSVNGVSVSPSDPKGSWEHILKVINEKYPSLAANLARCHLRDMTERQIILEVQGNGFTLNMLRRNKNLAILRKVYRDLFNHDIDFVIEADQKQDTENQRNGSHEIDLKNEALRHPRIADAIEIFDGKVIDVKLL